MKQPVRQYSVDVAGTKLSVEAGEDSIAIDSSIEQPVVRPRRHLRSFTATFPDGTEMPAYVEPGDDDHEYVVYIRGEAIPVRVTTARDERLAALRRSAATAATSAQILAAPMPGMLKQMLVDEGQIVEKGDSLCILEAMKMENEIKSPARLRVQRLIAVPGTAVEKGARLIELAPVE